MQLLHYLELSFILIALTLLMGHGVWASARGRLSLVIGIS